MQRLNIKIENRRLCMPLIRVEMLKGRTQEQKRYLVKELTNSLVKTCGGTPESVDVIITDIEKENWSVGGKLFSDKN